MLAAITRDIHTHNPLNLGTQLWTCETMPRVESRSSVNVGFQRGGLVCE
jgi:hypothetical protein